MATLREGIRAAGVRRYMAWINLVSTATATGRSREHLAVVVGARVKAGIGIQATSQEW